MSGRSNIFYYYGSNISLSFRLVQVLGRGAAEPDQSIHFRSTN